MAFILPQTQFGEILSSAPQLNTNNGFRTAVTAEFAQQGNERLQKLADAAEMERLKKELKSREKIANEPPSENSRAERFALLAPALTKMIGQVSGTPNTDAARILEAYQTLQANRPNFMGTATEAVQGFNALNTATGESSLPLTGVLAGFLGSTSPALVPRLPTMPGG